MKNVTCEQAAQVPKKKKKKEIAVLAFARPRKGGRSEADYFFNTVLVCICVV